MADLPDLIAQLRAAAENATKGEWLLDGRVVAIDAREQVCCGRGYLECCGEPEIRGGLEAVAESSEVDAAYIIAAQPQNITRILDAYAEMEREAERLRDAIRTGVAYIAAKRPNDAADCMTRALQQKDKADE